MTNAELISMVRSIAKHGADWRINEVLNRAADAIEAAEKRIAELEAQLPKEGEWIDENRRKNGTRPDWCPICGVLPEQHGDLIDRDELKRKKVYSHERHEYVVPVAFIDWEHAVIEAERKDDEQIH